jgi:hypothetical protein
MDSTRKRGGKSKLPPRVPSARRVPRLSEVDFATEEIARLLKPQRRVFASILANFDLHNDIRAIVADYIADRTSQAPPKEFRRSIRAFKKALEAFLTKLPAAHDPLAEALNGELDQVDAEAAPDLMYVSDGLSALLGAVKCLETAENGRGTDANRPAHTLLDGLARIYKERTGKSPSKKIDGQFGKFVEAVNRQIPERFQLNGLEHLIRTAG